ncbi:MAG: hypothetical protein NVSMB56_12660 [Pyrinomonadaceae bacterium]
MNRCLLSFVAYLLTFIFGVLASEFALPIYGELASHPLLRGLFAGVLTISTAIFLISGVIRVICGNKLALTCSARDVLVERNFRELRD